MAKPQRFGFNQEFIEPDSVVPISDTLQSIFTVHLFIRLPKAVGPRGLFSLYTFSLASTCQFRRQLYHLLSLLKSYFSVCFRKSYLKLLRVACSLISRSFLLFILEMFHSLVPKDRSITIEMNQHLGSE